MTHFRLLVRPEDERRWIDLFWEAYFPSGRPIPTSASRSYTCTWTETARKSYSEDDSLRYALWANCLLMTGRRHGAVWMLREGSKLYGQALAYLRRSLEMSHGARRDALIATVKLLSLFEVLCEPLRQPDNHHHLLISHAHRLSLSRVMGRSLIHPRTGNDTMVASSPCSSPEPQWHMSTGTHITYSRMKEWRW
jgi:hypothetical protein